MKANRNLSGDIIPSSFRKGNQAWGYRAVRLHREMIVRVVWDEFVAAYEVRQGPKSAWAKGQIHRGSGLASLLDETAYQCESEPRHVTRPSWWPSEEEMAEAVAAGRTERESRPFSKEWVYFAQCSSTKRIKIGWTKGDPAKRVRHIQSSKPLRLLFAFHGTHDTEKELHEEFAHLRAHNEWFRPGEDLLALIEHGISLGTPHIALNLGDPVPA